MSLNYYAISRMLETTARPIGAPGFGALGLMKTVGELVRSTPMNQGRIPLNTNQIDAVVEAFEAVRDGFAPDRILWDTDLADRFYGECAEKGIVAAPEVLGRVLLVVRKNPGRYAALGIRLSPTTKRDPQPSIVHEHAHAIEFSLVKLRYRLGASIDEILMSPRLASEFVKLATSISPGVTSKDLRIGALYIRKNANWEKSLAPLKPAHLQRNITDVGSLAAADPKQLPDAPGLFEMREGANHLYVALSPHLRMMAAHFINGPAIQALRDELWQPDPKTITLHYYRGDRFENVALRRWQLRLVSDLKPVFNWPVLKRNTAA